MKQLFVVVAILGLAGVASALTSKEANQYVCTGADEYSVNYTSIGMTGPALTPLTVKKGDTVLFSGKPVTKQNTFMGEMITGTVEPPKGIMGGTTHKYTFLKPEFNTVPKDKILKTYLIITSSNTTAGQYLKNEAISLNCYANLIMTMK
jgi:hypothetical protein